MKRACITGGAGFIGSTLADRLIADGMEVVVVDNFRTGKREFLERALTNTRFSLVEADVGDREAMTYAFVGAIGCFTFRLTPTCAMDWNTLCWTWSKIRFARLMFSRPCEKSVWTEYCSPLLVQFTVNRPSFPRPRMSHFLFRRRYMVPPSWLARG